MVMSGEPINFGYDFSDGMTKEKLNHGKSKFQEKYLRVHKIIPAIIPVRLVFFNTALHTILTTSSLLSLVDDIHTVLSFETSKSIG